MANSSLLSRPPPQQPPRRVLAVVLWSGFLLASLILAGGMNTWSIAPGALLAVIAVVCQIGLLILYRRLVGSWSGLVVSWALYSLARMGTVWSTDRNLELGVALGLLLTVYGIMAGFAAVVLLAIRRDVSVAYLAITLSLAPMLMRAGVARAGGLMALLQQLRPGVEVQPWYVGEPFVMAMSCMVPVGLLAVGPHFLRPAMREWRQEPL